MIMKITEEENKKLKELYIRARTMPVMLVGSVDLSRNAWDDVARYMDELGKKYGIDFSERKYGITQDGEIKEV